MRPHVKHDVLHALDICEWAVVTLVSTAITGCLHGLASHWYPCCRLDLLQPSAQSRNDGWMLRTDLVMFGWVCMHENRNVENDNSKLQRQEVPHGVARTA